MLGQTESSELREVWQNNGTITHIIHMHGINLCLKFFLRKYLVAYFYSLDRFVLYQKNSEIFNETLNFLFLDNINIF
jgi:hypothetical protein